MNFRYRSVKLVPLITALALSSTACKQDPSTSPAAAGEGAGRAASIPAPVTSLPSTPPASPHATTTAPTTARTPVAARTLEVVMTGGVVLPNRALTPGTTNPTVSQATIRSTICLTGYTRTIRPSSTYTTALKRRQLAAGYTFRGDRSTSDYEEDHLISLELGGSPTSVRNLWPEPYGAAEGARVKDGIENRLHDLVCSGRLTLQAAQRAIATNWWTALQRYGTAGAPRVWDGVYGVATTTSTSGTSGTSSGPTARCRDGSYSYSQHRSGTCSHHGGVARWIHPPPS